MHLVIQIPCYNEEKTLPSVLQEIPKQIPGISSISVQIIDDGSSDRTIEVARSHNVDYILINKSNQGLGRAFQRGMEHALFIGADILVNTDGDNQYPSKYIIDLVSPILNNEADIVIGDRKTGQIKHFSSTKKFFQSVGTWVVKKLVMDKNITDAVSGFRAYNKDSLKKMNITSKFSYVLDSTIQANSKGLTIKSVDITVNPPTRPSRLFKSIPEHIRKSSIDILRIYSMYQPLKVFLMLSAIFFLIGTIPIIRFLADYLFNDGQGKIQSLIIGTMLVVVSVILFALGIIGDISSKNRELIERILYLEKNKIADEAKDVND